MKVHRRRIFAGSLFWTLLCGAMIVIIGREVDWGRQVRRGVPTIHAEKAEFVAPNLSEPTTIRPADQYMEIVLRPLFIWTRRPPPPVPIPEPPKPVMAKGQFTLVGTTITPEKRIAFLLEKATRKVRAVSEGEQVNGITVKAISPESVMLTQHSDVESVTLSVIPSPSALATAPAAAPLRPPPIPTPSPPPTKPAPPAPANVPGGAVR